MDGAVGIVLRIARGLGKMSKSGWAATAGRCERICTFTRAYWEGWHGVSNALMAWDVVYFLNILKYCRFLPIISTSSHEL